jgi:twinkle protein
MNIDIVLNENGITLKHQQEGNQKVKCPQCQPPHKSTDNPLSVTITGEGVMWKCHHCEWTGGRKTGSLYSAPQKVNYTRPKAPTPDNKISTGFKEYMKGRGISEHTYKDFKIVEEGDWFSFQYFDENGELTNIKYRTQDKRFRQSQNAKSILYNYDRVCNAKTVIFTEGEFDVLALNEVGFNYATTLPNGAPKEAKFDANDARYKALENCKLVATKIVLFTDNDESGKALHKELLHRFGKDICWFVTIPDNCKDANEVLIKHGPMKLREIIDNASPYPIEGLYTIKDYASQINDLYEGNYEKPTEIGMEGLDDIYKIMTGTFHVITGIPNHGKSAFADQMLLNLAKRHGWSFALFSPEHSTSMHIRRLVQMYLRKPFDEGLKNRMNKSELNEALEFIHKHFYFIETKDAIPSIELILSIAKSAIYKHGIKGLVIDPFNEVSAIRKGNQREDEHIRDFISLCKRFTRVYEVVCWVIAHPTKLPKTNDGSYLPPSAYDISGSSHWSNQADAILTVHRDFDDNSTNVITRKIREQGLYGRIGEVKFKYDTEKHCYTKYHEIDEDWYSSL